MCCLMTMILTVVGLGWGRPLSGQPVYADASRADYVDLLLTIATLFVGAIGVAVTLAALVIGLIALKTLREIKSDASAEARVAAATKITETMAVELQPSVDAKVAEVLPKALRIALLDEALGHKIFKDLAEQGTLDDAFDRAAM